jgi:hypothetical protein
MARSVVLMDLIRDRMPGSVSLFIWWFRENPRTAIFTAHGRRAVPGRGVNKPRKAFAAAGCGEYRAI